MLTFLSLFAGIGGLDLGLERAGMRCVAQVEIDPFARAVLAKHWPDVPQFEDVRTFGRSSFDGPVQLICGGFPCQDISVAGKGAQLEGQRSGLWWEYHRIIGEFRPAWVLAENVAALRGRGADDVLSSLEALGYSAWPFVVGAEHVGAPHRRHRVWIVAHLQGGRDGLGVADALGVELRELREQRERAGGARPTQTVAGGCGSHPVADPLGRHGCGWVPIAEREAEGRAALGGSGAGTVADTMCGEREVDGRAAGDGRGISATGDERRAWPSRPGEPQHEWEAPRLVELPLGGAVDGVPVRLVRAANRHALRAYGNAVVPACAEVLGRVILAAHEAERGAA